MRVALIALGLIAGCLPDHDPGDGPGAVVELLEPDPSKARALDRWPNDEDLARLKSVEGRTRADALRILGHPSAVERRADGTEVWTYPWLACCQVHFTGGVADWTFYTAGY